MIRKLGAGGAWLAALALLGGCGGRALPWRGPPASSAGGSGSGSDGGGGGGGAHPQREICNGVDDDLDGRIDEGCPIRLTRDAADDIEPEVAGGRVAWRRVGVGLYVKALPDGPERQVASDPGGAFAFDGQRVVFLAHDHYVVQDVDSGAQRSITPVPYWPYNDPLGPPAFAGRRVLWQQHTPQAWDWDEHHDVFAYDLDTGVLVQLSRSDAMRGDPVGDAEHVAWADGRRFHDAINEGSLYDVYTDDAGGDGRAVAIGGDAMSTFPIALGGGRVLAYETQRWLTPAGWIGGAASCQLITLDLESGARTALEARQPADGSQCDAALGVADGFKPEAFDGRRLVRERHPLDEAELYLYDLGGGTPIRLTAHPRRSSHPRLDGDALVWQDDRNDQSDLYYMDLTDVAAGDVAPQGNPLNGDCDGGDRGGCIARVGRAYGFVAPALSGTRLVYAGHDGVTRVDLDSGASQILAPVPDPLYTQYLDTPYRLVAVSGDDAAWVRGEAPSGTTVPTSYSLFIDRGGGGPERVAQSSASTLPFALDAGRIAWVDRDAASGASIVWMSTGVGVPISVVRDAAAVDQPALSGDWLVYTHVVALSPYTTALVAVNVRTHEERRPADGLAAGGDDLPRIDGDTIVWRHSVTDGSGDDRLARAYAYDLGSGARQALSPIGQAVGGLGLGGAHACWNDLGSGVWLANVRSGQTALVSGPHAAAGSCAVSDAAIAFFEDGRAVYERRLESSDP